MWNINALSQPFFCLPSTSPTSCHSHCNNHLSSLSPSLFFFTVQPPSALFPQPSQLVTCHPLHPLLLGLLSWFPSASHLTPRRFPLVHALLCPPSGHIAAVTAGMGDRRGLSDLFFLLPLPTLKHLARWPSIITTPTTHRLLMNT